MFFCLLVLANNAEAQKEIAISDNLLVNATKLKVKMGVQRMGKIWNFSFGDYAVVSSKMGWTTTKATGNLWGTQTESKSTDKFSFVLANKSNDTAEVNAANNIDIQSLRGIEIISNIFIGDERSQETISFSAFITNNRDTSELWTLFITETKSSNAVATSDALLTNGERKILLTAATSAAQSLPALGYEFIEDGKSLAALQYFGGGLLGQNKNVLWLDNRISEKMKMILAAAATAILQHKN